MYRSTGFILLFIILHLQSIAQTANRYDVIIDEMMVDPSPQAGLPNAEFIELKNASAQSFNLNGWRISDGTSTATITVNFTLQPDSFVVICSNNAVPLLSAFGKTIGVSGFPSLDNDGDLIFLKSKEGVSIHAVEYNTSWYQNPVKSEGGWTLEMMDTKNPCSGYSNWKASVDPKGGTPGQKNSVDGNNADATAPALIRAFVTDSLNITLTFDEPLDSNTASLINNYSISDGVGAPQKATAAGPLFNKVLLQLNVSLQRNKVYTIIAKNVSDCKGIAVGIKNTARIGVSAIAGSFDVVINEILFNPKPDGADYIELYNRSNRIINLKELYIANRNSTGAISSLKQLAAEDVLFFPQDYLVATENAAMVKQQYTAKNPEAFAEISSLPSYPDDKGTVVLLNNLGEIIDELRYEEKWHFALISNNEGVSLERIDYNKPTQDKGNWHSAATDAGYGTPTYRNSQFKLADVVQGTIAISPEVFSPDNDGFDDFLTVHYQFPEPGYVCNITIFDAGGRPVRNLVRNGLCGLNGYFRWDGLDEKNQKLNMGIYVVLTEVFNLKGKVKKFKNVVTLAKRL
jgi:hypothetical protein